MVCTPFPRPGGPTERKCHLRSGLNWPSTARSGEHAGEWPAWVSFWFSGCWRALAKGTAWADFVRVYFSREPSKAGNSFSDSAPSSPPRVWLKSTRPSYMRVYPTPNQHRVERSASGAFLVSFFPFCLCCTQKKRQLPENNGRRGAPESPRV